MVMPVRGAPAPSRTAEGGGLAGIGVRQADSGFAVRVGFGAGSQARGRRERAFQLESAGTSAGDDGGADAGDADGSPKAAALSSMTPFIR